MGRPCPSARDSAGAGPATPALRQPLLAVQNASQLTRRTKWLRSPSVELTAFWPVLNSGCACTHGPPLDSTHRPVGLQQQSHSNPLRKAPSCCAKDKQQLRRGYR